jgi:hypothetical protein
MNSRLWKAVILALLVAAASAAQLAWAGEVPGQVAQIGLSQRDRGAADVEAAYASGHLGMYMAFYSDMPNGPEDPALAPERDLLIAVLRE